MPVIFFINFHHIYKLGNDGGKRNLITHLYSFPSSRRFNWVRQLCSYKCFISSRIWALKESWNWYFKRYSLISSFIKNNCFIFSKNKFFHQRTLRLELSEEMKRITSLFAKFNIQCNIFCKYLRQSLKLVNSKSNQSSWVEHFNKF